MTKTPAFYTVSMGKFSWLYFASQGVFGSLWFYQHWLHQLQQQQTAAANQPPSHPLLLHGAALFRALFAVFFVYDLLQRLQRHEHSLQQHYPWNPKALSFVFIGTQILHAYTSIMLSKANASPLWLILTGFIFLINYYLLYKVQLVANRVNQDPFGKTNATLTPINVGFMAAGFYLWLNLFYNLLQ